MANELDYDPNLPSWEEIITTEDYKGLSNTDRTIVRQSYLKEFGKLPEWKALSQDQKSKVMGDMLNLEGGSWNETEVPSMFDTLQTPIKNVIDFWRAPLPKDRQYFENPAHEPDFYELPPMERLTEDEKPGGYVGKFNDAHIYQQAGDGKWLANIGGGFKYLTEEGKKDIEAEWNGVLQPWVDPIMVGSGAFGSAAMLAQKAGATALQAAGRGALAAVTTATAEFPIGTATEIVGEEYPRLALPFTITMGILSGVTVERAIEKHILRKVGKIGDTKAIRSLVEEVKTKLAKEDYSDPVVQDIVRDINQQLRIGAKPKSARISAELLSQIPDVKSAKLSAEVFDEAGVLKEINSLDDIAGKIDERGIPAESLIGGLKKKDIVSRLIEGDDSVLGSIRTGIDEYGLDPIMHEMNLARELGKASKDGTYKTMKPKILEAQKKLDALFSGSRQDAVGELFDTSDLTYMENAYGKMKVVDATDPKAILLEAPNGLKIRAEASKIPVPKLIISKEAVSAARKSMSEKLNTMHVGIDPTILKDLSVIGAHHVETGIRDFNKWSKIMLQQFGPKVRPHLEDIWDSSHTTLAQAGVKRSAGISVKASGGRTQEFFSPWSTLPDSRGALLRRYKQFGDIATSERIVERYMKRLKPFDADVQRDIFRYLDGQIDLSDLPKEAQSLSKSIRERQMTIGKMLVKRGQIKQETFDNLQGKYVHYMYARYILGDDADIASSVGSSGKMNMSTMLARNPNITAEQRTALGLIEDASVAVPVGMGKSLANVAKFDYLSDMAQNPNWTWRASFVDVPDVGKFSIGKLTAEVNEAKNLVDKLPGTPEVLERYTKLKSALDQVIEESGKVPADFKQLPNDFAFGPLAGAYVRKPIFDDLMPIIGDVSGKNHDDMLNQILKIEREGMQVFKAAKVALNFPTAVRNTVSMFIQNNMRGRALGKIPMDYFHAGASILKKDANFALARKYGLFKTNFAQTEIEDIMDTVQRWDKKGLNLISATKRLARHYGKLDDFGKHAIFVQLKNEGYETGEAILEAQKWGMDYSLSPRTIKGLRRHFIPFITYQYKIAPLLAESLAKRPWVIGKYIAAQKYLIPLAAQQMQGMTQEEWTELKKDFPSYVNNQGSYNVLPWKSPDNNWQWVNTEYFFPWGNHFSMLRNFATGDFKSLRADTGIGNPFLNLFEAWGSGKDPFTKQKITNELKEPYEQWLDWGKYVSEMWLPPMLTKMGARGYTEEAIKQYDDPTRKDKWGRTIRPSQALGRWFGVNIVEESRKQTGMGKKAAINALVGDLIKIKNDPDSTPEDIAKAKERMKMLTEDIKESR